MPGQQKRSRDGTGNALLDAIPAAEFDTLQDHLEQVEVGAGDGIYDRRQPIEHVHFPVSCVISLVSQMEDGRSVEVATVGNEGMVGVPLFLQAGYTSAHTAFGQVPGQSFRIRAQVFTALLDSDGTLHTLLQRYTQALFSQVAQSSACNRLHPVEQRCARWLLMTHDRVTSDQFPLTQEFLALMLGVQRTSVNAAAGALQGQQLIRYSRGKITILNRAGLEAAACECYRIIREEFDRLVPA